jgi:membrane-associated phospholipid phosphatase
MSWHPVRYKLASYAIALILFTGCTSVRNAVPTSDRLIDSAIKASQQPETWGPLAGAALIGFAGWDKDISDWAIDNTPVFGSRDNAMNISDHLQNTLIAGMAASSIFAPVDGRYCVFPAKRVTANALAFGSSSVVVNQLKGIVGRQRPNGGGDRSFPSSHAVKAFTSAYLIEQNIHQNARSPLAEASIKAGSLGLAATVAWARVEGEMHYPSDVMVSAAIGHFFARTFYHAFVTADDQGTIPFSLEAQGDGFALRFRQTF